MDITVKTNKLNEKNGSTLAIANVEFGNMLKVKNITVKEGKNGMFVSMPSVATNKLDDQGNTIYKDMFNPITAQGREELYGAVLESMNTGKEVTISKPVENKDIMIKMNRLEKPIGNAIAIGNIILNEDYVVNSVTVRETAEKVPFVSFPSYKTNEVNEEGKAIYKNFVYPADKESKAIIDAMVMDAFDKSKDTDKSKEIFADEPKKGVKSRLKESQAKAKEAKPKAPKKTKEAARQ